jgi:hypothetical protein
VPTPGVLPFTGANLFLLILLAAALLLLGALFMTFGRVRIGTSEN